jgi:hypothetical protein
MVMRKSAIRQSTNTPDDEKAVVNNTEQHQPADPDALTATGRYGWKMESCTEWL